MRARAIALATLMLVSIVAVPLGGAVATVGAQSGPSGMVALGSDQVSEDLPDGADAPLRASDLEGNVYAADHADTLEVIVTTPERADQYLENANVVSNGDMAIVLRDDEVHDGRDVAIETDILKSAVGHLPRMAYGTHSSGEEWNSPIERDGTIASWNVPKFSENTVTFTGQTSITADPAESGAQFEYGVGDANVSDASLSLTGVINTQRDSTSGAGLGDGDSLSVFTDGNREATNTTAEITAVSGGTYANKWTDDLSYNHPDLSPDANSYVGVGSGNVAKYWSENQTQAWQTSVTNADDADFAPDGTLYVTTTDYFGATTLKRLNPQTGEVQWTTTLDSSSENNGPVLEGTNDGAVVLVDSTLYLVSPDGTEEWDVSASGSTIDGIGASEDNSRVYVIARDSGSTVTGYNLADGSTAWSNAIYDNFASSLAIAQNGDVYAGNGSSNEVTKLDSADGAVVWEAATGLGERPDIAVSSDSSTVFVGNSKAETTELLNPDGSDAGSLSGSGNPVTPANESGVLLGGGPLSFWEQAVASVELDTDGDGTVDGSVSNVAVGSTEVVALPNLSAGANTVSVSTSGGTIDLDVGYSETTTTENPTIELNSDAGAQTVSHSGTLSEGETVDLSDEIDESLISGNVTVGVGVSEDVDGPIGQVGLNYSHDATTVTSTEYQGEAFSERYSFSRLWEGDRSNAKVVIPWASDRVIELRELTVTVDPESGGPYEIVDPNYEHADGELVVEVGDVNAGDVTEVNATGSKVQVVDGEVTVTEPTDSGQVLDSEVRVDNAGEDFRVSVGGTEFGDRVHQTSEESWQSPDTHMLANAAGDRYLMMDPPDGSTFRVSRSDITVSPQTGAVETEIVDNAEPEFQMRPASPGDNFVSVTWHDASPDTTYGLFSKTLERDVDTAEANSPVTFSTAIDESQTFVVETRSSSVVVGPTDEAGGDSFLPDWLLLFGGVIVGLAGLSYVTQRRTGPDTSTARVVLTLAVPAIAVVWIALELLTVGSLTTTVLNGVAAGAPAIAGALWSIPAAGVKALQGLAVALFGGVAETFIDGGLAAIVVGVLMLIAVWQINERTEADMPRYQRGIVAGVIVLYIVETIAPGTILGGLAGAIDTAGPILLFAGIYLVYQWWQTRQTEAATPDTQVEFTLDGDGNGGGGS